MWERCPRCGSDHVTAEEVDVESLPAENVYVATQSVGGRTMPGLSLKRRATILACLDCQQRWEG